MDRRFLIVDEITRQYGRFNVVGTQFTVRPLPPSDEDQSDTTSHFLDSVTHPCEHVLRNCNNLDVVGFSIRNEVNMRDKAIGISCRPKDQLSANVILNVCDKVTQFNSRFNALDALVLEDHIVKMHIGFGGIKTRCRQLAVLVPLQKGFVSLKSATNCFVHALIIAIAKIMIEPDYKEYIQRRKLARLVQ